MNAAGLRIPGSAERFTNRRRREPALLHHPRDGLPELDGTAASGRRASTSGRRTARRSIASRSRASTGVIAFEIGFTDATGHFDLWYQDRFSHEESGGKDYFARASAGLPPARRERTRRRRSRSAVSLPPERPHRVPHVLGSSSSPRARSSRPATSRSPLIVRCERVPSSDSWSVLVTISESSAARASSFGISRSTSPDAASRSARSHSSAQRRKAASRSKTSRSSARSSVRRGSTTSSQTSRNVERSRPRFSNSVRSGETAISSSGGRHAVLHREARREGLRELLLGRP